MCRLFGLTAGTVRTTATFWLLDAPDSLAAQSHRNPDGTGLGTFDPAGDPVVEKQPLAGYADADFAREAHERVSSTFVAHVRKSSGTPVAQRNTHPFTLDGRIFAHNGVINGVARLEARLGDAMEWVQGDTDSERWFALITQETQRADGDVAAGITNALAWINAHLEVVSANFILTTATELWALRWPEHNELWFLDRRTPGAPLHHRSPLGTHVHSTDLADTPSVVVASEPLDGDDWHLLEPGELLHVQPDLGLTRTPLRPGRTG